MSTGCLSATSSDVLIMTTFRCESEMGEASRVALDHARNGIDAGWKKPASRRRVVVSAPHRESLRSFLNGVIIGLAIVGPIAVLDATENGFLALLFLWGALALAAAALHRMGRGSGEAESTERDGRNE